MTALPSAPVDLVTAANNLINQLDVSIVISRAQPGYPGANGLSVYLPGTYDAFDSAYIDRGAVWSLQTTWDEFVIDYKTN